MTNYTINTNHQFNSLEITFNDKPSEKIREKLKALKFRWNPKKSVWYGFAKKEEVEQAIDSDIKIALDDLEFCKVGGEISEGYMGAIKWIGANFSTKIELPKLNRELKKYIKLKYNMDVLTKYSSYSGGQSDNLTLIVDDKDLLDADELIEKYKSCSDSTFNNNINSSAFSDDGYYTFSYNEWFDNYKKFTYEERYEKIKEWYNTRKNNKSINNEIYLKDHAKKCFKEIKEIMNSYNYDNSNSMVDYFNRYFYDFYYIQQRGA